MIQLPKKFLKQVMAFVCEQYLVLFLMLAIGIKLFFFNTYVTKVTWSESQYTYGIICGYLSAAVVFSPLFFVRRHKNKLAVLLALFITTLLLIDTIYYSYFTALPTVGLLSSLGQTQDIGPALETLLRWWFALYFVDIALVVIFHKPIKSFFVYLKEKHDIKKPYIKTTWTAVIITLIVFWMTLLPMGISNLEDVFNKGYDGISTSQYYGVLMTHAIDIVRFIQQETTRLSSSQVKTLSSWVKYNKPTQTTDSLTGIAKGKNVIMIQVESLGGFVVDQKVNNKELTPNLDKLAQTSHYFPNERFLYGAGHTSDTDFVANSSYFPLPDAAVFVRYGRDNFTSLPKTLISNGYSAFAYHGFNRDFWNRDVALRSLGYQKFYAADNYPKGANINMGLNDGDFLSKTAEFIKDQPKPSLSYVITLSSHVPFAITDQTKELGINPNDYPDQVGGYLENINYVDRMLGKFFEKLKSEGLYDDSLILVYGDHIPVLPAFSAGTIKYDPSTVQVKEVPLIIKLPKETTGETHANQGVHIDIMPTVLDLLGVKTNQLMFGQSLFASGNKALKVCTDQLVAFSGTGDCNSILTNEKNQSATIIRYNQFNNLSQ